MPRTIYFDYNASTPLDPQVREAMLPYLSGVWGNPSSVHHVGRRARAALDDARDRAAKFLVCKPSELIFTSGGTESNNLAIFGAARLLKPGENTSSRRPLNISPFSIALITSKKRKDSRCRGCRWTAKVVWRSGI